MKYPLLLSSQSTIFFRALFALIILLPTSQALFVRGDAVCQPDGIPKEIEHLVKTVRVGTCEIDQINLNQASERQLNLFQDACRNEFIGQVSIVNNPYLKRYKLKIGDPFTTPINLFFGLRSCHAQQRQLPAYTDVLIMGNQNLVNLDLRASSANVLVEIRGNGRLTNTNQLKQYFSFTRSEIQYPGECAFLRPLNDMAELNPCTGVFGHVNIDQRTRGTTTTGYINSDFMNITISNSNIDNVRFLLQSTKSGTKLQITDNKNLCLSIADEDKLLRRATHTAIYGNGNSQCRIGCTSTDIRKNERCTHVDENLLVNCQEKTSRDIHHATFVSVFKTIGKHKEVAEMEKNHLPIIGNTHIKELNGALTFEACSLDQVNKILRRIGNIANVNVILKNPNYEVTSIDVKAKSFEVHSSTPYPYMKEADMIHSHPHFTLKNVQKPPKGVCVFPHATNNVKGCEKIEGDLRIVRSISLVHQGRIQEAVVEPVIKEITGCLNLYKMKILSYEFLTKIEKIGSKCRWWGGKSYIEEVDCIPYSLRSRINLTELADMANHPSNYEKCGLEHCVFTSFAKEITNCTVIDRDLALDENSTTVETAITTVTGCISIVNTRLPNYDFLKTIESFNENCTFTKNTEIEKTAIDNNTCIPYTLRRSLKNPEIKKLVESGNNKKGCGECPGATVEKLKEGCKVILGDLKVDKLTDKSKGKMEKRLATVEEVYGQLLITDNNASTIEFKNLRIVETSGSGPAIQIVNNSGLVTIETPALESTITNNTNKVVITGNPKWNASATFLKKIKKVTGKDCGSDKKSGCYFAKVVQKPEKVEEKQDDKKEEEGLGAGATAAIVVVVLIVVLALVAGGVVAAVLVVRKKKSSKKGEAGPAGKQPPGKSPGKAVNKQARKGASDGKGGKKTPMTPTTPRSVRTMESDTKLGMKSPSYEAITPTKSNEAITPATATKSNEAITPTASKEALTPIQKARTPATKTRSNEALTPIGSKEAINHKAGKPKVVVQPNKKPIAQPAKKGAALPGKKPVAAMPIKGKK